MLLSCSPRLGSLPSTSSRAKDWAGPAWKRTSPASSASSELSTRMCFFPGGEGGASEARATSPEGSGMRIGPVQDPGQLRMR
jgi:hypothetical protein